MSASDKTTEARAGWICQRCGRSNSPDVGQCNCHPPMTREYPSYPPPYPLPAWPHYQPGWPIITCGMVKQ